MVLPNSYVDLSINDQSSAVQWDSICPLWVSGFRKLMTHTIHWRPRDDKSKDTRKDKSKDKDRTFKKKVFQRQNQSYKIPGKKTTFRRPMLPLEISQELQMLAHAHVSEEEENVTLY